MLNLVYLLSLTDESNYSKVMALYAYHDDAIRFAKKRLKMANVPSYEHDAEDVVQNAYENIIRYIDSVDFSVTDKQLKSYTFSIVVNEINAILKSRIILEDIDECDYVADVGDIVDQVQAKEDYDKVVKAIKSMDERYSMVLFCRYIKDMDAKEIADKLKIPTKTVYTRLRRGKAILYGILRNDDSFEKDY